MSKSQYSSHTASFKLKVIEYAEEHGNRAVPDILKHNIFFIIMAKCLDVTCDFGQVRIGSSIEKPIRVVNHNEREPQEYEVRRDTETNPLDYVFEVKPYNALLEPGQEILFKLSYFPKLANAISYDYFSITCGSHECITITAKGECIGPRIVCITQKLIFLCLNDLKDCTKNIILKNHSDVYGPFIFDVDEEQSVFKLNNISGTVLPHKTTKIEVTFKPPAPGCYMKRLYCLLRYKRPIMIEAIGVCMNWENVSLKNINIIRYPELGMIESRHAGYLCDSVKILSHKPPVSLSINYLDFGERQVGSGQSMPSPISITNHTNDTILFKWDVDRKGVFSIRPQSSLISSESSALFEAYFQPSQEGEMYGIILDGYAYWGGHFNDSDEIVDSVYQVKIPIPVCIQMMGHTFNQNSPAWIPHCDVLPQNVVMPASVPQVPIYTIFMIVRYGRNPLMFKFIPPPITNYTLKPMQGIITTCFQIILVELNPHKNEESAYFERWGLQLNGLPKYETHVDLQGYAENPHVQIATRNLVVFPATFPGCEQVISVPIRNVTRHCLRYSFRESYIPNNVKVVEKSGILVANEIKNSLWQFTPYEPGEHAVSLMCEVEVLEYKKLQPLGKPFDIPVMGYGYSEYVDLVSLPEVIDFGTTPWGEERSSIFHLFNFGNCQIHYKLKVSHSSFIKGSMDITVNPIKGSLGPSENHAVNVTLRTNNTGLNVFVITYDVQPNSDTDIVLKKYSDKVILVIRYVGVFPTLTVEDLRIINGGPIYSKLLLWKILNINKLNEAFKNVKQGCMIEVPLNLPTTPPRTVPLIIDILLWNRCGARVSWNIKRKKNCKCELQTVDRYISFRCQEYNCPHRPMLRLSPSMGELEPGTGTLLRMEMRYKIEGDWQLKHVINLPNDRQIMLVSWIQVINPLKPIPICLRNEFQMMDTWLGDEDPVTQVFWLYNNGLSETTYEIDETPFTMLKLENYNVEVIKCMNPKGKIYPQSAHAVRFSFSPLELKTYKVTCVIKMRDEWQQLHISGSGAVNFNSNIHKMRQKMPESRKFTTVDYHHEYSVQHIVINPISMYSSVDRIFFLENKSPYHYEYHWFSFEIPGVLDAKVYPQKFSLRPTQFCVCKLTVISFGQPCLISIPVTCRFVDITIRRKHGKSVVIHSSITRALEGQFTITEDSMTIPVCDFPIEPISSPTYYVINVTCSILSRRTFEETMSLQNQLKQMPDDVLPPLTIDINESTLTRDETCCVIYALEVMIWEVVNSKWFDNLLERLRQKRTPYYAQFKMTSKEYSTLVEQSFITPPVRTIENALNNMIYEILHKQFRLGPPLITTDSSEHHKHKKQKTSSLMVDCKDEVVDRRSKSDGKISFPLGW